MDRDRHDGAGQAEHVDGGDEADLVVEEFEDAILADRVFTRAGRRLHGRRRENDGIGLEEHLPAADVAVAISGGAHEAFTVENIRALAHAGPGDLEIVRGDGEHAGLLQCDDFCRQNVGPGAPHAVDVGNLDLLDAIAGFLQVVGGLRQRRAHGNVDLHVLGNFRERDLDRALGLWAFQWRGNPPGVARIALAHGGERETGVGDRARQRALRRHEMREHRALACRAFVIGGNSPLRRLDGDDAIAMGRPAQRAADVVAMADRADAGRDRRARAAGRAAAGDGLVPRIEGQAMQRIVGEGAERKFRRVGQAEHDGAGLLQVAHHGRIRRRDKAHLRRHAVRIGAAFVVDVFLDGDRHAVQRWKIGALGAGAVGGAGSLDRFGREIDDNGVELRIDRVHALDMRLDGFLRRNRAVADGGGGLDGGPLPDRRIGHARLFH